MSTFSFDSLPPELVLCISPCLVTSALNSLASSCRRLHALLQPELEARLTPDVAQDLTIWSIRSHKPHFLAKLLAPPHSIDANKHIKWDHPLLVAAASRDLDCVRLLLDAGANVSVDNGQEEKQALHSAVQHGDLAMARLLLARGAHVDVPFGCDGVSRNSLHVASELGNIPLARLLLDEFGANLEADGHYGTPLAFAVHARQLEMVRFLLNRGANATVNAPLFILLTGGPPPPLSSDLIYMALGLRSPIDHHLRELLRRYQETRGVTVGPWAGLPLTEDKRELLALLTRAGASHEKALRLVQRHVTKLAESAMCSEAELLEMVRGMLKEAEDFVPSLSQ